MFSKLKEQLGASFSYQAQLDMVDEELKTVEAEGADEDEDEDEHHGDEEMSENEVKMDDI
jgi:hypothetical protein